MPVALAFSEPLQPAQVVKLCGCVTNVGATTFTSTPALQPPTQLTATNSSGPVSLRWFPAPAATVYHIKRATTPGGPYTAIARNVAATHYRDTTATGDGMYYYVVSARHTAGENGDTAEVSAGSGL